MRPFGELFLLVQRVTGKRPFRAAPRALAILALVVGSVGVSVALAGPAAGSGGDTLYVNSTGSNAGNDCTQLLAPCATVSYAVSQALSGDTIEVAGTVEDNVTVPSTISDLTIAGDEAPIGSPAVLEGANGGTVVTVSNGSNVTLDYLTIENGSTAGSGGGIENDGTLTVNNTTVTDNVSTGANGAGIDNTGTLTVSDSTISDNVADQNGGGISSEAGTVTISDTTISGNSASADGGGIDLAEGAGQITDSTITANTAGSGGGIDDGSGNLAVVDATISSNSSYGIVGSATTGATIVAENTPADCQSTLTSIGYNLSSGSSCGLTSTGDIQNTNPDLGALAENGGPTLTLLPGVGSPAVGAVPNPTTLDNGSFLVCGGATDQRGVNRPFDENNCNIGAVESSPGYGPRVTTIGQASFNVSQFSSFQMAATAAPPAIFTETGALPAGVTLNRAGVLSGTPAADSGGIYSIVVTASNGVTPAGTQDFTLTVSQPATIAPTSPSEDAFLDGSASTFTVSAIGMPTPLVSATLVSGKLPTWLSVSPGVGSATLSGTPPLNTKKIYDFLVKAVNSGATATQNLTLTVGYPPAFLSAAASTFKVGTTKTFSVRTSGYPASTVTETGPLPDGLAFSSLPNGRAEINGIAQPGSGGVYDVSLTATSVTGTAAQPVVLTVDERPTITSAASATFTHGTQNSITVETSHAYPAVTDIEQTGVLPAGVTFTYLGNGTATLAGEPTAARTAPYHLRFVAITPIAKVAQAFTLTVN